MTAPSPTPEELLLRASHQAAELAVLISMFAARLAATAREETDDYD